MSQRWYESPWSGLTNSEAKTLLATTVIWGSRSSRVQANPSPAEILLFQIEWNPIRDKERQVAKLTFWLAHFGNLLLIRWHLFLGRYRWACWANHFNGISGWFISVGRGNCTDRRVEGGERREKSFRTSNGRVKFWGNKTQWLKVSN